MQEERLGSGEESSPLSLPIHLRCCLLAIEEEPVAHHLSTHGIL